LGNTTVNVHRRLGNTTVNVYHRLGNITVNVHHRLGNITVNVHHRLGNMRVYTSEFRIVIYKLYHQGWICILLFYLTAAVIFLTSFQNAE